jgi:hypothetical protein
MAQIFQAGQINLTALVVPDAYVQILPPAIAQMNGVPTNILGIVGTASWGPVNAATICGSPADFQTNFGGINNRKYDLLTAASVAYLQGAQNFRLVRVTDGTDEAATGVVKDAATPTAGTGMTLTAIYTGSNGDNLQATVSAGSAASTYKVTVALPGQVPEVYDNIAGTGATFWANAVAAINNGNSPLRGPSQLVVATVGASVTAPALVTTTFAGGTDGATTITGATLVGADGGLGSRTGMYALRGTGCGVATLADNDLATTWTTQVAYGLSEQTYMIGAVAAGTTIAAAATAKQTAGIDSYIFKLMHGDWIIWADPVNKVNRLLSPASFVAGLLANLAPMESSLNKQVYGIVGTQTSQANQTYSNPDLQALGSAGIDLICNPIPQGSVFGVRFGRNTSSNATINGDNYTRMTNYLATTVAASVGQFVGQLQSTAPNDPLRASCDASTQDFLQGMVESTPSQLDSFSTQCNLANNPPASIAAGNMIQAVNARYLAVVTNVIVNLQGGQNVVIQSITSTPAT